MGTGTSGLRDRMVRDAIVELLHGLFRPGGAGFGHVGAVTVDGHRAAVELVLIAGWRPAAAELVADAACRLQSLAEVDHFEIAIVWKSLSERGATMPTEAQLNAIKRYATDVWSKGDHDAIDEIFTPDRVRHGPDLEGTSEGAAGHKDLVTLYRTSLPDLTITIEAQIGDGDTVVTRWRGQATNLGPTLGVPPTGKSCDVFGFWMHRFDGEKIAEEWAVWDTHGFLQQIGVSLP